MSNVGTAVRESMWRIIGLSRELIGCGTSLVLIESHARSSFYDVDDVVPQHR